MLLVFSQFGVRETALSTHPLRWLAVAVIMLALAAVALDLIARFQAHEVLSLLLVAGIVGLTNSLLISHAAVHDLPLSLIARPLGAHPLAFVLALGAFRLLISGRMVGPLDLAIALIAGLAWGVWMRWLPDAAHDPIPVVAVEDAILALALGLVGAAVVVVLGAVVQLRAGMTATPWQLTPLEWGLVGGVLGIALAVGIADGSITAPGWVIVLMLLAYAVMLLAVTRHLRRAVPLLPGTSPVRSPNLAGWLVLVILALVMGWIGYRLPGNGDTSVQSDVLFGALMGFGLVWLPGVSAVLGIRAVVFLSRQGL